MFRSNGSDQARDGGSKMDHGCDRFSNRASLCRESGPLPVWPRLPSRTAHHHLDGTSSSSSCRHALLYPAQTPPSKRDSYYARHPRKCSSIGGFHVNHYHCHHLVWPRLSRIPPLSQGERILRRLRVFLPHQRRDAPIASTPVKNRYVPEIKNAKNHWSIEPMVFLSSYLILYDIKILGSFDFFYLVNISISKFKMVFIVHRSPFIIFQFGI